jgi:hypothetical protein
MITIFCTLVLLVIQGVALDTGVLPFSKGRALQRRNFLCGTCKGDEDIPTLVPSSPLNDDQTIAAKKVPNNDIRIGPITRTHAKLLEQ